MKKKLFAAVAALALIPAALLWAPIRHAAASTYTILYSQWIQASMIDSTPIGSNTPSSGNFTTLQLNSAAPAGHILIGNGSNYADTAVVQNAGLAGSRSLYGATNPDTTPPAAGYIYQNTSDAPMIVTVSADGGGGGFHGDVYCDANASPTTLVAEFSRVNSGSSSPNYYPGSVAFVVPAGYYYGISVTNGAGTPSITTWTEWVL